MGLGTEGSGLQVLRREVKAGYGVIIAAGGNGTTLS